MTNINLSRKPKVRLIMLGTFPPPITGASESNASMRDLIAKSGIGVEAVDTSPASLDRRLWSRLARFPKLLKAWLRLVIFTIASWGGKRTIYVSIAGGLGLIYDFITLIIVRILRWRVVIHHHNWTYLRRYSLMAYLVIFIAGRRANHIVLCKRMARELVERYGIKKYLVFSNIGLIRLKIKERTRVDVKVVGFISNLTVDKGVRTVITLARHIKKRKSESLKVVIAGPCYDHVLAEELREAERDGILEWIGAVHGADKEVFWDNVDVLVFPTRYANEAEPLVVWEAMASACPVIAYGRGCIPEQLVGLGLTVPVGEDFCAFAVRALEQWVESPSDFEKVSWTMLNAVKEARVASGENVLNLLSILDQK